MLIDESTSASGSISTSKMEDLIAELKHQNIIITEDYIAGRFG